LQIEDHTIFRQGLALTLERELDLRVVAQAASFDAALAKASVGLDIAVVDLSLPDGDGAELVALRRANRHAAVLALTRRDQRERHARAFEAGVDEVVRKNASAREIISAIENL